MNAFNPTDMLSDKPLGDDPLFVLDANTKICRQIGMNIKYKLDNSNSECGDYSHIFMNVDFSIFGVHIRVKLKERFV